MNTEFAQFLERQLMRREWSQADFAQKIRASSGAVSMWMRGTRVPSPASCERIADAFGLDVDSVLTLAGHRPATDPVLPDDPRAELIAKVKRIHWNEDRLATISGILNQWLDRDRKDKQ